MLSSGHFVVDSGILRSVPGGHGRTPPVDDFDRLPAMIYVDATER
jgi:hypothetical protein